ncbi:MAG: CbtA family protein [Rhodospirillaceae bacterium]|nr:CbtA family protein [Rhodospirillaceae bacterium]
MQAFRQIVLAAALAGLIGGLVATAAQIVRVVPLIYSAEGYEQAAHAAVGHAHDDADEGWAPAEGVERLGLTAVANVLTGVGFALLLSAAFALRGRAGWRSGLLWGAAGFLTFTLAPAIGLPPELPGAAAAPLAERQLWWWLTVAATGGGLALVLLDRRAWAVALGLVLIVLPHVVGVPRSATPGGAAPPWMERQFVAAALATSLLFWLVLGAAAGFLYGRFAASRAA